MLGMNANATDADGQFRDEIRDGLSRFDDYSTISYAPDVEDTVVYYDDGCGTIEQHVVYSNSSYKKKTEYDVFIPTTMYVRMGGGINLSMATKKARVADEKFKTKNSWNVLLGLGWNLSPYVRAEIDLQELEFKFKDLQDADANYHMFHGMFYFDLMRRYVDTGNGIYRRTFVPFIGVGAGIGEYEFSGPDGAGGLAVAAPRAELGMNFMLNKLIGIDITYQYQMMLGHGFGWNTSRIGVDSISNIMATFRVNF